MKSKYNLVLYFLFFYLFKNSFLQNQKSTSSCAVSMNCPLSLSLFFHSYLPLLLASLLDDIQCLHNWWICWLANTKPYKPYSAPLFLPPLFIATYIHHQVTLIAEILLTFSHHLSLSFCTLDWSSKLNPLSTQWESVNTGMSICRGL